MRSVVRDGVRYARHSQSVSALLHLKVDMRLSNLGKRIGTYIDEIDPTNSQSQVNFVVVCDETENSVVSIDPKRP